MAPWVSTVIDWRLLCSTTLWCAFKVGRRSFDLGGFWPLVLAPKDTGIVAAPRALQPVAALETTQIQHNGEQDASTHSNLVHGSLEQWDYGKVPQDR